MPPYSSGTLQSGPSNKRQHSRHTDAVNLRYSKVRAIQKSATSGLGHGWLDLAVLLDRFLFQTGGWTTSPKSDYGDSYRFCSRRLQWGELRRQCTKCTKFQSPQSPYTCQTPPPCRRSAPCPPVLTMPPTWLRAPRLPARRNRGPAKSLDHRPTLQAGLATCGAGAPLSAAWPEVQFFSCPMLGAFRADAKHGLPARFVLIVGTCFDEVHPLNEPIILAVGRIGGPTHRPALPATLRGGGEFKVGIRGGCGWIGRAVRVRHRHRAVIWPAISDALRTVFWQLVLLEKITC